MAITNPEVEFHLPEFISECVEMLNEHYQKHFSGLDLPAVRVSEGSKYYKVFKSDGGYSKSAWFFVSKEDGLIWKPASWKAPARNFPRGNILEDKARDVISIYGL